MMANSDAAVTNDETTTTTAASPEQCWRGCSMEEIHRHLNEFELEHLPAVRPSAEHTVLHHFPIRAADNEPPRPLKSHPKWDATHVRLPCSAKSQYPLIAEDGSSSIESRWQMIEKALLQPITNSHELQAVILSYNTKYDGQWNFRALHKLFEDELDESETCVFFEDLLPRIIRLALRLPELIQAPIPLLKQDKTHAITLTQQQISCLLANAFLCTFPRRNTLKRKSEYSTFPDINFNRLFQSQGRAVLEKIKCICHYFRRVCPTQRDSTNVPCGVVTFMRRSLRPNDLPNWSECNAPLGITPLHISDSGTIEDQGYGLLQVDFANKFLGGGVLGHGCVQEEIRFVICPELLVSKLFTECLRPTEALLMVGCERYANYTGYAETFQWAGNHEDNTPRDTSRRILTHVAAIDALRFTQRAQQYREDLMLRELNKAYVGFLHTLETAAPGIASGNWGCGAFGGDATLKALLQLMACTATKRPLVYFTFGNAELRDQVHDMHTFFIEKNVRVRDLWQVLKSFHAQKLAPEQLYSFIYSSLRKERSPNLKPTQEVKRKNSSHTCSAYTTTPLKTPCQPSKKTTKSNVSQDLFDSSPEMETAADEACAVVQTAATFSQDSSDDALLLAAVENVPECSLLPSNKCEEVSAKAGGPTESPQTPSSSKRVVQKQRTLLEMLDQCYTKSDHAKASKRPCLNNIGQQK